MGKTLLAERLPGILPDLDLTESLEVSAIHSLAGVPLEGLVRRPPYADPHHSASMASLVGGGARIALPGAASRAHRGVLFLDDVNYHLYNPAGYPGVVYNPPPAR